MNIYEEEQLEQKLDELTDTIGQLVLGIILFSVKKVSREYMTYSDIKDSQIPNSFKFDPF